MSYTLPAVDYRPIATTWGGSAEVITLFASMAGAAARACARVVGSAASIESDLSAELLLDLKLAKQAESKLPSEEAFRKLAATHCPPQSWYDEDFDGF